MRILVHTCCAPCLIYPRKSLTEKGFEIESFYYNPNIHPPEEYHKRKKEVEKYTVDLGIKLHIALYNIEEFFRQINQKEEAPLRCNLCWRLRLSKTARFAAENGFEIFTTTLLVSPYQDSEALKKIGEECAIEAEIKFYYEDFRVGYKEGVAESKERGIYRQKYCGCLYSIEHRA
ncbi:MAG: epoxyqueuosine reductase QueH [Candidatus Omnitrophota bacterium]